MVYTLRVSGYSEKERFDSIRGAVSRQEEMRRMVSEGEIPSLHRTRKEILQCKARKSGILASTWFLKGETSRSVKCHPTPGGRLAKLINKAMNPEGNRERTHIVEEGGIPVISSLKVNNPFFNGKCRYGDEHCIVKDRVDCGKTGCLYEITCNGCKDPVLPHLPVRKDSIMPGEQPRYNYVGRTMTSLHNYMAALGGKYQTSE